MRREYTEGMKILNREQIKYIAIVLMTFNHIAHVLLNSGSILYEIFEDLGYFTAITMCFFLVEGYEYTHSRKEYAKRLLIFTLISEIPFVLALGYFQLNVIFTLLICFLILCVMDSEHGKWKKRICILGLILLTAFCDGAFILAIAAILFKKSFKNPRRQAVAYCIMTMLFWLLNSSKYIPAYSTEPLLELSGYAILHGFYAALGFIFSGIAVLLLYNGKKSERHRNFNKWFFYIYYPAHLMVLWLISLLL